MKAKCYLCKTWDEKLWQYVYHMAKETDWKPPSGYDPNLRQFRCAECGGEFYKMLDDVELAQEFKEKHPVSC